MSTVRETRDCLTVARPNGNGASVVVSGRESRPHGEGRQVGPDSSREGMRNAESRHGETEQTGEPDAAKVARPVRRGAVGKGPLNRGQHLAGGLPYTPSPCLSGLCN